MERCDYKVHNKKQQNIWHLLPQDLLLLIISQLHYSDQVRFRAVCKNWRVPKELVKCSDTFPWVFSYVPKRYASTVELFDHYSQKVYKVSISGEKVKPSGTIDTLIATKDGWWLMDTNRSLFLHNPFTNKVILLPYLSLNYKAATFSTSPSSPNCEIFVLWMLSDYSTRPRRSTLKISSYSPTRDVMWSTKCLGSTSDEELLSVQYLNGSVYCLFDKLVLKRYCLADKSFETLTVNAPRGFSSMCSIDLCWLIVKGKDLLVACGHYRWQVKEWKVFKFDFCETKSWVDVGKSLKGCAFFISDRVAFCAPLKEEEGCRLFYFEDRRRFHVKNVGYWFNCYSLNEDWKILSTDYSWMTKRPRSKFSFVEPPYNTT